jgi:hypothetical protein
MVHALGTPEFEPFSLPPLPLSLHSWLTALTQVFFERHKRGIAALMLLNIETRHWAKPVLPQQTCDADGASFRLREQDFDQPATYYVGGSFQLTGFCATEQVLPLIPRFDGLHILMSRREGFRRRHFFLRADGENHPVVETSVLSDDWRDFLNASRHRLSFG